MQALKHEKERRWLELREPGEQWPIVAARAPDARAKTEHMEGLCADDPSDAAARLALAGHTTGHLVLCASDLEPLICGEIVTAAQVIIGFPACPQLIQKELLRIVDYAELEVAFAGSVPASVYVLVAAEDEYMRALGGAEALRRWRADESRTRIVRADRSAPPGQSACVLWMDPSALPPSARDPVALDTSEDAKTRETSPKLMPPENPGGVPRPRACPSGCDETAEGAPSDERERQRRPYAVSKSFGGRPGLWFVCRMALLLGWGPDILRYFSLGSEAGGEFGLLAREWDPRKVGGPLSALMTLMIAYTCVKSGAPTTWTVPQTIAP